MRTSWRTLRIFWHSPLRIMQMSLATTSAQVQPSTLGSCNLFGLALYFCLYFCLGHDFPDIRSYDDLLSHRQSFATLSRLLEPDFCSRKLNGVPLTCT